MLPRPPTSTLFPYTTLFRSDLNPLAPLIRSYRFILLDGKAPDWPKLSFTYLFAILCFTVGYWWFERTKRAFRSEEHTSELQSHVNLVCRLLLEKKKKKELLI